MVHQTISSSSARAPKASSKMTHMAMFREAGRRFVPAAILGVLAACASAPREGPAPVDTRGPAARDGSAGSPALGAPPALLRPRSRWIAADWLDLPGWYDDRAAEVWPALLRGCERPAFDWLRVCTDARAAAGPMTDAGTRAWLQQRLQPYRVEALEAVGSSAAMPPPTGAAGTASSVGMSVASAIPGAPNAVPLNPPAPTDGLLTGYFEPLVEAVRQPSGGFRVPLYLPPPDLATRKPYWTRQQIERLPAARTSLRGRELAWVADPLDALILQIQGSGRLWITEPDASRKLVRVAFAGHNDQPYKSVGRWLIEQGELTPEQASWPAIKAWARRNPRRVDEMLWSNPRVVFFREEALPDPAAGPRGAQGVPLTPGRSIAVDPQSIPYGAPVWLDSTEPLASTPLRRLVMAQDTGSAIAGAVRADYFWGWGELAEQQAGRTKQPLRLWVLWPK